LEAAPSAMPYRVEIGSKANAQSALTLNDEPPRKP
jgi:hypothetical protein